MRLSISSVRDVGVRFGVLALGALTMAGLAGCAYSQTTRQLGPASANTPRPGEAIAVMLAEHAPAGPQTFTEPGRILADLTLGVIREDFPSARLLDTANEIEALQRCRDQGVPYLVVPSINHWGNNTTLQSRFADSVSVDLRLLQVATKQMVRSIHYQGSNNSVTVGSNVPEALADENYRDAVKSLLRDR